MKTKSILIPEGYQPDSKDTRLETGGKYVRMYHQDAYIGLENKIKRLEYHLAKAQNGQVSAERKTKSRFSHQVLIVWAVATAWFFLSVAVVKYLFPKFF